MDGVKATYARFLGPTPIDVFIIEVLPIVYVTIFPLVSALFVLCGRYRGTKSTRGRRILRRVQHAVGTVRFLKMGVAAKTPSDHVAVLQSATEAIGKHFLEFEDVRCRVCGD